MKGVVVLPVFNKASVLIEVLDSLETILKEIECKFEYVIVDDASTDHFSELNLAKDNYTVLHLDTNGGKGNAIKAGISFNRHIDFAVLFDADLDIDPNCLPPMIRAVNAGICDIAISSKLHKDSLVNYTRIRRLLSRGYYLLIRFLFQLTIKDTQTGAKVFGSKTFNCISENQQSGFVFDLEALLRAKAQNYKIMEFPVSIRMTENSSVTWKDVFKMFYATLHLKIYRREY